MTIHSTASRYGSTWMGSIGGEKMRWYPRGYEPSPNTPIQGGKNPDKTIIAIHAHTTDFWRAVIKSEISI